jgi:hypothetical protein
LALIKADTKVPCCAAMRPRVSPDATVYVPPEEVVVLLDEELADELDSEFEPPGMLSRSPG